MRAGQDRYRELIRSGQLHRELHHLDRLRAELGHFAPPPARVRQLESLVHSTGPHTGWAFTDHRTRGPHGLYVVRLYVPVRASSPARAWLRRLAELLYWLARGAALAPKLMPALRGSSSQRHEEPMCRDQQDPRDDWRGTLARLMSKAGIQPAM